MLSERPAFHFHSTVLPSSQLPEHIFLPTKVVGQIINSYLNMDLVVLQGHLR